MIATTDLHWAAGFLEGEGSFVQQRGFACLAAVQVQKEPLERLIRMFGGKIYLRRARQLNHQEAHQWVLSGKEAIGVMMTLYTLFSPRRKDQVRAVIDAWRGLKKHRRDWVHCSKGHPYVNGHIDWRGNRQCILCARAANLRKYYSKKERRSLACAS